jgi:replication fork protection complex subunit Csm3/Swi3
MVEKAGHKKRVMIARNEYISESKPKDTAADDEEDDLLGGDSTSRPMGEATTRPLETERPRTPEQDRDVPDDDDLYDATPRRSRPIVPVRDDVPEEDDLEALIGEAEGQDKAQNARLTQEEPDDDDLDALMAEAEGRETTKKSEPPRLDPDEDDLDALMAEAESQDQMTRRDGQTWIENRKGGNAYEDEEAAIQEMDGLW